MTFVVLFFRYGQNIDHGLLYYLHTDHTQVRFRRVKALVSFPFL